MNASVAGVGPNMNGAVPWSRANSAHTSTSVGSNACAAPTSRANSRRGRLRSIATTSSIPRSTSVAIAISPIGPHPNTATLSPAATSAWFTACMPTASGSANAATRNGILSGTRNSRRPRAASRTSSNGVSPPSAAPLPIEPCSSPGYTMTALAHARVGDLVADPIDDARDLVAECHRLAGQPAHVDVRHVAAADATRRDPHEHVARTGCRIRDVVEADVVRPVDADLLHRRATFRCGAAVRRRRGRGRAPSSTTATRSAIHASSISCAAPRSATSNTGPEIERDEHAGVDVGADLAVGLCPFEPLGSSSRCHCGIAGASGPFPPGLTQQPDQRGQCRRPADLLDRPAHHRRKVGGEISRIGHHVVTACTEHRVHDEIGLRTPPAIDRGRRRARPRRDRGQGEIAVPAFFEERDGCTHDRRVQTGVPRPPRGPLVESHIHSDARYIVSQGARQPLRLRVGRAIVTSRRTRRRATSCTARPRTRLLRLRRSRCRSVGRRGRHSNRCRGRPARIRRPPAASAPAA